MKGEYRTKLMDSGYVMSIIIILNGRMDGESLDVYSRFKKIKHG